jgi:GR25 family glycosyltransferase involved in LPS biosynthesis
MQNKFKGIPKIYYLNLDHRLDRNDHMISQFERWGITNYERVSASRFSTSNVEEWEDLIIDKNLIQTYADRSSNLNHLKTIIDWYDNDDSEYCIIMEDDINLNLAVHWMFDWKYLMNNLPYNWDCIQFYVTSPSTIPMYLRKRLSNFYSSSCYMITRHFAKKLKYYHYDENHWFWNTKTNSYDKGKYKLFINNKDLRIPEYEYGTTELFIYDLGLTYSLPIFNLNRKFSSDASATDSNAEIMENLSSESIFSWWVRESRKYTSYDFFNFNKKYDWKMEIAINTNTQKYRFASEPQDIWI